MLCTNYAAVRSAAGFLPWLALAEPLQAVGAGVDERRALADQIGDESGGARRARHAQMAVPEREEHVAVALRAVDDGQAVGQGGPMAHPLAVIRESEARKELLALLHEDARAAVVGRRVQPADLHVPAMRNPPSMGVAMNLRSQSMIGREGCTVGARSVA